MAFPAAEVTTSTLPSLFILKFSRDPLTPFYIHIKRSTLKAQFKINALKKIRETKSEVCETLREGFVFRNDKYSAFNTGTCGLYNYFLGFPSLQESFPMCAAHTDEYNSEYY